jgi:ribosomal protein S27E
VWEDARIVRPPEGDGPVIRYSCPSCNTQHTAPYSQAGQKVFCSSCGQKLLIPSPQNKTVLGKLEDATSPATPQRTSPQLRRPSVSPLSVGPMPQPYSTVDRAEEAAPAPAPSPPPPRYDYPEDAGSSRIKPGLVAAIIGILMLLATGLFIAALVASRNAEKEKPAGPTAPRVESPDVP